MNYRYLISLLLIGIASVSCQAADTDVPNDIDDVEATPLGEGGRICAQDIPCDTINDCPATGIHCVIGVCERGLCAWVNLATVATLPIDPVSGLPIGQHCRD